MPAKNLQASRDPRPLHFLGNSGELGMGVQRNQAPASALTDMPVSMQGNGGARSFHSPHARPELRVRLGAFEGRVLVVGYDGQDGPDPEFVYQGKEPFPAIAIDRRAEIVKTKKVLSRYWKHGYCLRSRDFGFVGD